MTRIRPALLLLATLAAGCGTNRPDIPKELLQPVGDAGASGYPAGPYGSAEGATVENFLFTQGWMDPEAAGYDPAKLAPIQLSDFYDPDGTKGIEILLINTAAVWCSACKAEHGGSGSTKNLNDHFNELSPKGFRILSLLFQDAQSQPPTADHLVAWTTSFETHFPMALDPEFQMGRYASAETAPLNMVVDARTMKILKKYIGDKSAVIWPYIENELDKRAAQ